MRALLLCLILASQARAWEVTVGRICTLHHDTGAAEILLTYDPAQPLYTIAITRRTGPWDASPWFAMRFDGPVPIEIGTSRHSLSADATALSVTDTGFGNVLDGLEFNDSALAFTEARTVPIPLDGAAPKVRRFRACTVAPLS